MKKQNASKPVDVSIPPTSDRQGQTIIMDPPKNLRREKNTPWPGQPLIPTKLNGYG